MCLLQSESLNPCGERHGEGALCRDQLTGGPWPQLSRAWLPPQALTRGSALTSDGGAGEGRRGGTALHLGKGGACAGFTETSQGRDRLQKSLLATEFPRMFLSQAPGRSLTPLQGCCTTLPRNRSAANMSRVWVNPLLSETFESQRRKMV